MDSFFGGKKGSKGGKHGGGGHYWGKSGGGSRYNEDGHGGLRLNADTAMQSTTKTPPAWDPRLEKRGSPFRIWLLDLAIWRNGCEIQEERHGALVAQRLGGVAKVLARHIPPEAIRNGVIYQGQPQSGFNVLIRGLSRRFGGYAEETAQHAIVELLSFRRLGDESIDDALGRLETLKAIATEVAGFDMGVGALSWMLPIAMNIPRPA